MKCPECNQIVGFPEDSKEIKGAKYTRCHSCKLDIWIREG